MRIILSIFIFVLILSSCATQQPTSDNKLGKTLNTLTIDNEVAKKEKEESITGQIIYVPIYSYIYFNNKTSKINLAATLSIRNTDIVNPITIYSIFYYDSAGKLIRNYITQPFSLQPMASTEYVIEEDDVSGGIGANFLVEWYAKTNVSDPILEAIMVSSRSGQGMSFISQGRVIKKWSKEAKELTNNNEIK